MVEGWQVTADGRSEKAAIAGEVFSEGLENWSDKG